MYKFTSDKLLPDVKKTIIGKLYTKRTSTENPFSIVCKAYVEAKILIVKKTYKNGITNFEVLESEVPASLLNRDDKNKNNINSMM